MSPTRIPAAATKPVGWRHTLTRPAMSTYRAIRVEVEGTALNKTRERFTTTVIVSAEQRARGRHRAEALFRAGVWGLAEPLCLMGEEVGMSVQQPAPRYLRSRPWREPEPTGASEVVRPAQPTTEWPSAA